VKLVRLLDGKVGNGYDLFCPAPTSNPAAPCTISQVAQGGVIVSHKLSLARAQKILEEFFKILPPHWVKTNPAESAPDLATKGSTTTLVLWEASLGSRKSTGIVPRWGTEGPGKQPANVTDATPALRLLEAKLKRETRP
jgi:hypothetical protein